MDRWRDTVRKWRALSVPERATACLAYLLLPLVSLSLRCVGLGTTTRLLERKLDRSERAQGSPRNDFPASCARLVAAAAQYHPGRPACLAKSVTLWFLLARRGIASSVRIGVAKNADVFRAHAWVEVDGRVLLDGPDVATQYSVIV
jgi:hypothetical protein